MFSGKLVVKTSSRKLVPETSFADSCFSYLDTNFPTAPIVVDAPISAGCTFSALPIGVVLRASAWPDIYSAIIKAISVGVVNIWRSTFQNVAVHVNVATIFASASVNKAISATKRDVPVENRKPRIVGGVHDGYSALCKRDELDRIVLRLNHRFAGNAILGHDLTSNEIVRVQPHFCFSV